MGGKSNVNVLNLSVSRDIVSVSVMGIYVECNVSVLIVEILRWEIGWEKIKKEREDVDVLNLDVWRIIVSVFRRVRNVEISVNVSIVVM